MGSGRTMAAPGAAGSAASGHSAPHICSHNARSPRLQQVRPSSASPPGPSQTLLRLARGFFLVKGMVTSHRRRQGEEGKLTLGFEDLQVLFLLNGVLATCDCPPSMPPPPSPAAATGGGDPAAGSALRKFNAHYSKTLSLAYKNATAQPNKRHDSYTLKCFETSEIAIVLSDISC